MLECLVRMWGGFRYGLQGCNSYVPTTFCSRRVTFVASGTNERTHVLKFQKVWTGISVANSMSQEQSTQWYICTHSLFGPRTVLLHIKCVEMTNFLDIHRLSLIKKTHDVLETGVSVIRWKRGHLLCWTQQIELVPIPRDRLQSPKRRVCFFYIKDRRWIMSKKVCHFNNTPSSQTFRI
jgi:hypothetical protein